MVRQAAQVQENCRGTTGQCNHEMVDQESETGHLWSLFGNPASRAPGGDAHQLAAHISSRRWVTDQPRTVDRSRGSSRPLRNQGLTYCWREHVSDLWLHKISYHSRRFARSEWVLSRLPSPAHHEGEKGKYSLGEPIDQHHCVIGFANTCHSGLRNESVARLGSRQGRAQNPAKQKEKQ